MAPAVLANNFYSVHSERPIWNLFDFILGEGGPKARPTGPRVIFRLGGEQFRSTSTASVDSLFLVMEEFPGESGLGSFLPQHLVLLRVKLFLPFLVGLVQD